MTSDRYDIVLVGGGLANALIAWRLATSRSDLRWCLLERGSQIGGTETSRTWSFHHSDLTPEEQWIRDLQSCEWSGYQVAFPGFARHLPGGYASIRSADLHDKLVRRARHHLRFGAEVTHLTPKAVVLTTGNLLHASMVIDGRGLGAFSYPCGYQKFLGLDLRLAEPHGLTKPLLMDATVDQADGYRFVYVLPWSEDRVLVEDTYYDNSPSLNEKVLAGRLAAYVERRKWTVVREEAAERGVLPIPLASDAIPRLPDGIAVSGVGAGRFHPTTGYSFAHAARLATEIAQASEFSPGLADRLNAASQGIWRDGDFFRRLNNMMFLAAEPAARWRIMAQFYRRDESLIRRFYRGRLRPIDRLQLLSGKAPVPMTQGLKAFFARPESDFMSIQEGGRP